MGAKTANSMDTDRLMSPVSSSSSVAPPPPPPPPPPFPAAASTSGGDTSNGSHQSGSEQTSGIVIYDVEHLATFSTNASHENNNGANKDESHGKNKSAEHRTGTATNSGSGATSTASHDTTVIGAGNNSHGRDGSNGSDGSNGISGCGGDVAGGVGGKCNGSNNSSTASRAKNPKAALQKLFELEKQSGIWTQHMQIELRDDRMLIIDCETNSIVERFHRDSVVKPEAFNHYNHIYNNIVVFTIKSSAASNRVRKEGEFCENRDKTVSKSNEICEEGSRESDKEGNKDKQLVIGGAEDELHIFQCVSHEAQQLVSSILAWKAGSYPVSHKATNESAISSSEKMAAQASSDQRRLEKKSHNNGTCVRANDQLAQEQACRTSSAQAANMKPEGNTLALGHSNSVSASSSLSSPIQANGSSGANCSNKPVVTVASSNSASENVPIVNVNVKETVQVFNQIAALRERSKPTSPTNHARSSSSTETFTANTHSTPAVSNGASSNGSGNPSATANQTNEPARSSLANPGAQLYKQRSIRVTLAPKQSSNNGIPNGHQTANSLAEPVLHNKQERISTGSSSASSAASAPASASSSSGSSSEAKQSAQASSHMAHQVNQQTRIHQSGAANINRAADYPRHPTGAASRHELPSSNRNGNQQKSSQTVGGHQDLQQKPQHLHQSSSDSARSRTSSSSQSQLEQLHKLATCNQSDRFHLKHLNRDAKLGLLLPQEISPAMSNQLVTTNESYVSVLNHCFDDIENFITRLQQTMTAVHELQAKKRTSKRSNQTGGSNSNLSKSKSAHSGSAMTATELALLSARARGPKEDDYFEILSKFKLAFNLLAKLKGCIHEPNAPELVHFLFTPLAIIIESARNASPPIDPTLVGIPYLNQDALDLLSNCCTSKESDMWISLGPNWTQTIDMSQLKVSRLPSSFQPIFSDGWAPIIGELELIGLVGLAASNEIHSTDTMDASHSQPLHQGNHHHHHHHHHHRKQSHLLDEEPLSGDPYALYSGSPEMTANYGPGKSNVNNGWLDQKAKSRGLSNKKRDPQLKHSDNGKFSHSPQYQKRSPYNASSGYPADDLDFVVRDSFQAASRGLSSHRQFGSSGNMGAARRGSNKLGSKDVAYRDFDTSNQYPIDGYLYDGYNDHPGADIMNLRQEPGRGFFSEVYSEMDDQYEPELRAQKGFSPGTSNQVFRDEHKLHDDRRRQHLNSRGSKHNLYSQGSPNLPAYEGDYLVEANHEAMLLDMGQAQTDWFYELKARGALIIRVLFTREANNDKELPVRRGEILEVLDDTRKWWRARNIHQQVAYVPHTIVAIMESYQTLDELLANNPGSLSCDEPSMTTSHQRYSRRQLLQANHNGQHQPWYPHELDKRHSNSSSAFRYF